MDIFVERVYREEKTNAEWTNRRILELMDREEKKTKLPVSGLLIKSLRRENILRCILYFNSRFAFQFGCGIFRTETCFRLQNQNEASKKHQEKSKKKLVT